ncbi:MAG: hypothetical protein AB1498_02615 [bacterium]
MPDVSLISAMYFKTIFPTRNTAHWKKINVINAIFCDSTNIKNLLINNGNRIIVPWKDDQGYNGLFSLEKVKN